MNLSQPPYPPRRVAILLGIVLLIGLATRLAGIDASLPYLYHPDEANYIKRAEEIIIHGDLNPHFFNYPSLFFYLNAATYLCYYWAGHLLGIFPDVESLPQIRTVVQASSIITKPSLVLLGRALSVAFSLGILPLLYAAMATLTNNQAVGLLAAFYAAISPALTGHSRTVTPDVFVAFFVVLTFYFAVRIYRRGSTTDYLLAGVSCGLVISSKYNGATVFITILAAHFLGRGWGAWKDLRWLWSAGSAVLCFALTSPFVFLDYQNALPDIQYELNHYLSGHHGMEGNAFIWYLAYLWESSGPLALMAGGMIVWALAKRRGDWSLLAIFPVVYVLFISRFQVRNDRTLLPALALIDGLAAIMVWEIIQVVTSRQPSRLAKFSLAALVLMATAVYPAKGTYDNILSSVAPDARDAARVWVDERMPKLTRFAIESYSPFINPDRYEVAPLGLLIDQPPEWYIDNGFDYLLASSGMYGRFYYEPDRYREQVEKYDALFAAFPLAKEFVSKQVVIRILEVKRD